MCFVAARRALAQTGTAALVGEVTDSQKQVIPGATVTVTHVATAASQVTTTDERGNFRLSNVQPGMYTLKVELAGFKTAIVERVNLQVDTVARETVMLELGGISETVSVVSETTHLNTTDASVGNVMSREQIRSLPVEAQNVVHLLSLQPGAVFIPTSNPATVDPRYGSVAGARADQQSVTLDGIDVNDPQNANRLHLGDPHDAGSAAGVPRQHLELQRRDGPLERTAGVAGHPQRHQSVRRLRVLDTSAARRRRPTSTSSSCRRRRPARKARRRNSTRIFSADRSAVPIQRNRLFFFANLEQLKEQSESPVMRNVPSNSMRDGVLMYQCAVAASCPGGSVRGRREQPHACRPAGTG